MWGELNDFADVWIQPHPGEEAAAAAALDTTLNGDTTSTSDSVTKAAELLSGAQSDTEHQPLSLLYALPHFGAEQARAVTAALANIAVTCAGEGAASALFILPQEANVWGLRDAGGSPDLLPGYRRADEETARAEMERLWGAPVPSASGLTFEEMVADGKLKALLVMNDNPLMLAPDTARVCKSLESLDFLAVIDSIPTDTANLAHLVLPDVAAWGREGTTTSADRRVLRMNDAVAPQGEAKQGWRILSEIGSRLAERFQTGEIRINYQSAAEIMDEMAQVIPLYANATYVELDSGIQQPLDSVGPKKTAQQAVPATAHLNGDGFRLVASRGLYTSYEGVAIHSPEADRLHREESVKINPADATALGIAEDDHVILRNGKSELRIRAHLTAAVQPNTLHVPLYYDGGAVGALFDGDSSVASVEVSHV
jgi:predicted molibdopterin-dependent oxidoreductase YjgC